MKNSEKINNKNINEKETICICWLMEKILKNNEYQILLKGHSCGEARGEALWK